MYMPENPAPITTASTCLAVALGCGLDALMVLCSLPFVVGHRVVVVPLGVYRSAAWAW